MALFDQLFVLFFPINGNFNFIKGWYFPLKYHGKLNIQIVLMFSIFITMAKYGLYLVTAKSGFLVREYQLGVNLGLVISFLRLCPEICVYEEGCSGCKLLVPDEFVRSDFSSRTYVCSGWGISARTSGRYRCPYSNIIIPPRWLQYYHIKENKLPFNITFLSTL